MKKYLIKILQLSLLLIVLVGSGVALDIYNDRTHKVEIKKTTSLFAENQPYLTNLAIVGILVPGQKLDVLRIRYEKDSMRVKVRDSGGKVGWIYETSKIRLIKSNT